MAGRTDNQEGYRFGFNGMEGDNEVSGTGHTYTTELRILDTRLGKWLSLDPMMAKFPWQSPFASFDNNPINVIDPTGGEGEDWIGTKNDDGTTTWTWDADITTVEQAQKDEKFKDKNIVGVKSTYDYDDTQGKHTYLWADGTNSQVERSFSSSLPSLNSSLLIAAGQPIIHKRLLKYIGMRGFVTPGAIPFTSPASIICRKIGLGGAAGRAVPGIGWYMTAGEVLWYDFKLSTDKHFLAEYDKIMAKNPYRGFVIEGDHLLRIDWQKIDLIYERNKKQYQEIRKKNPLRGFVVEDTGLFGDNWFFNFDW